MPPRIIHGLPFKFGGQVAKLFDLGENPMNNNPVESEQEQLDAKPREEFGLWLIDGERLIEALPITDTEKKTLVATLRHTLNVAEIVEGQ